MAIRCASKAIIIQDGCILLNRCRHFDGSLYYDLPGGGQHPHETLEAALIREVKEETGYTVRPVRFAAMAEEIYTDPFMHEKYPDYTHRILHIFAAQVVGNRQEQPTEKDLYMEESVWMPLNEAAQQNINPDGIAACLRGIIENGETVWLGSRMIKVVE